MNSRFHQTQFSDHELNLTRSFNEVAFQQQVVDLAQVLLGLQLMGGIIKLVHILLHNPPPS